MIGNLAHVAIAVPDLESAIEQYKNIFGAFVSSPRDLPAHGIRVAIVKLPNTTIELITPLGNVSPLRNFLKRNPQGAIHHLCYEVSNILKARDELIAAGLRVIGEGAPAPGYHGNPVLFFNPKDCLGVLIELEEVASSNVKSAPECHPTRLPKVSQERGDSFEGMEGLDIDIEVDFKAQIPEDNEERG